MKKILYIFLLLHYAFSESNYNTIENNKGWFISSSLGMQISGIKSEDFINSNISPLITLNGGLWFTSEIGLQAGYKGFYFNYINDKNKHHYNFFYSEVLLNLTEMFSSNIKKFTILETIYHSGAGYFYNKYYKRPNICGNIGIINKLELKSYIDVYIDISAIIGWDIYQMDEDILPSLNLGIIYDF